MERQKNANKSECKVCGNMAVYCYYGAIVCKACKVFFRRNAHKNQTQSKCHFDVECSIDLTNRHACSHCRLKKCFEIGMNRNMFRSYEKKPNKVAQIKTINILSNDNSMLTTGQWTLISNLSNCYDEYSGLNLCQDYLAKQNNLPVKIRFKNCSIIELLQTLFNSSQTLYEKNQDFRNLSSEDRCLLVSNTLGYVSCLSSACLTQKVGLTNSPKYYDTLQMISNPKTTEITKYVTQRMHSDAIVLKIFFSILSFSTMNLTIYTNKSTTNLSNNRQIFRIQNEYIELLWKYLIYKYNYQQAIHSICELLKCIFALHQGLIYAQEIQWYADTAEDLVQQTKHNLNISE